MKAKLKLALQTVLGLGLGVLLLALALMGLLPKEETQGMGVLDKLALLTKASALQAVWAEIARAFYDLNFAYVALFLAVLLVAHYLRAYRWAMLMEAAGGPTKPANALAALMVGYMTNNAIPRMGEVTRCTMLIRSDRTPITVSVGTVFTERAIDLLFLLLLVVSFAVLEVDQFIAIVAPDEVATQTTGSGLWLWLSLGVVAALAALGWLAVRFHPTFMEFAVYRKAWAFARELLQAALSIRKVRRPWLFWVLSVAIWVLYILVIHIAFRAYPFTQHISFYYAYVLTVGVSFAIAIPTPGGVGSFQAAVVLFFGLYPVYGAMGAEGGIVGLVLHIPQYLFNILGGLVGYLYLMLLPPKGPKLAEPVPAQGPVSTSPTA